MVHDQEIAALERQRQLLVTNCELHRMVLALQLKQLRSGAGQVTRGAQWLRHSVWALLPAALGAGWILTRARPPIRKGVMKLVLGWTLLRRARPLWTLVRILATRR